MSSVVGYKRVVLGFFVLWAYAGFVYLNDYYGFELVNLLSLFVMYFFVLTKLFGGTKK